MSMTFKFHDRVFYLWAEDWSSKPEVDLVYGVSAYMGSHTLDIVQFRIFDEEIHFFANVYRGPNGGCYSGNIEKDWINDTIKTDLLDKKYTHLLEKEEQAFLIKTAIALFYELENVLFQIGVFKRESKH